MRPDLPYDGPLAELRHRLDQLRTMVELEQLCTAAGLDELDQMLRMKRRPR